MDKIEQLIKQYLENSYSPALGQRSEENYPTASDLYRFLKEELSGDELERMLVFLRGNEEGQALIRRARRIMESKTDDKSERLDPAVIERAKSLMPSVSRSAACPHCGKPITPFKKPLSAQKWTNLAWMLLMAVSFALSFVFRRYFMQCLAVALLAGVQWAVQMRAMKTQILIYKALAQESGEQQHRLHPHSSRL